MKTLGKLKINSEKLLKNEELVNLKGGYGSSGDCTATDKITACANKKEGDACCWKYNGVDSTGKCAKLAPNYVLHCSNL